MALTDTQLLYILRERVSYDAAAGTFYRRPGFRGVKAGALLGTPDSCGRLQATFLRKRYMVSHLVWLWETGALPDALQHDNGDTSDARFCNLTPSDAGLARRIAHFMASAAAKFPDHDLSRVAYIGGDDKVVIGCPTHGWVSRAAGDYLASAKGCSACCVEFAAEQSRTTPAQKAVVAAAQAVRSAPQKAEYRRRNRALYNKASREWHERNKTDPLYRATMTCRRILQRVIAQTKRPNQGHTSDVHGYSAEMFREHIESQFEEWMSWDNHGEWHVDHIKPISWYIRNGITDPRIINALDNLQPLRAIDNLVKGSRLISA